MTTPREQLADTIDKHQLTENAGACICGWTPADSNAYAEYRNVLLHFVDVIIAAGWTPPPTPTNNTITDN